MYLPKALFLSTYCRSSALWRFFKAGALGCYDPQIIKPPEVLGRIREALDKNIIGRVVQSFGVDRHIGTIPRLSDCIASPFVAFPLGARAVFFERTLSG